MEFRKVALVFFLHLALQPTRVRATEHVEVTMGELSPESIRALLADDSAELQVPWPEQIRAEDKAHGYRYMAKFSNLRATRLFDGESGQFVMSFEPQGIVRFGFQIPEATLTADLKLKAHIKGDHSGLSDVSRKYRTTLQGLAGEILLRVQIVDGQLRVQSGSMTELKIGRSKFHLVSEKDSFAPSLLNAFTFGKLDSLIKDIMGEQIQNPRLSARFVTPVIQLLQDHLSTPAKALLKSESSVGLDVFAQVLSLESGYGVWRSLWQVSVESPTSKTDLTSRLPDKEFGVRPPADEVHFRIPLSLVEKLVFQIGQEGKLSFEKQKWGLHVRVSPIGQIRVKSTSTTTLEIQIPLRIESGLLSTFRNQLSAIGRIQAELRQSDGKISLKLVSAKLSDFQSGKLSTMLAQTLEEPLNRLLFARAKEAIEEIGFLRTQIPISKNLGMDFEKLTIEPDSIVGSICLRRLSNSLDTKD